MKLNTSGFTLVEILVVVGILALLFGLVMPNYLQSRKSANEASARVTLRAISAALESYSIVNNGVYPTTTTVLIGDTPPYLNKNYFSEINEGYVYSAILTSGAYTVTAAPSSSLSMGTFTISTGSVLTEIP